MVKKRHQKLDYKMISIISIIAILMLAILISKPEIAKAQFLAAEVNGEPIRMSEVNNEYENLPVEMKQYVTKEMVLDSIIELTLLRQEAEAQGIVISDQEFNDLLEKALQEAGLTREELDVQLKAQDRTIEDIKMQFVIKTLLDNVVVDSDEEGQQMAVQQFISELREKADIKIYME